MKLLSIALCTMLGLASMSRHARAESGPPSPEPYNLDLVVVIDEATLTEAVRARILQALPGVLDDVLTSQDTVILHLAVLGTSMGTGSFATCEPGTGGVFQATPSGDCSGPEDRFIIHQSISRGFGGEITNYRGSLSEVVACILPAGGEGCAFSQPMAALQAALDGSVSENDGFLRGDAVLAILVVTGADDCSASDPALFDPAAVDTLGPLTPFRCFEHGVACDRPIDRQAGAYEGCAPRTDSAYLRDPQGLATFLGDLKEKRSQVIVRVLAGQTTSGPDGTGALAPVEVGLDGDGNPQVLPVCGNAGASAIPATRLAWLAAQFNGRAPSSLCTDPYDVALQELGEAIKSAMQENAPPGAPDAGAGNPGDGAGTGGCGCSARPDDGAGNAASLLLGLALLAYLVRRRPAESSKL
jgi:MYXO-CTERM domain-containing protein